jgi:hypothetical protein
VGTFPNVDLSREWLWDRAGEGDGRITVCPHPLPASWPEAGDKGRALRCAPRVCKCTEQALAAPSPSALLRLLPRPPHSLLRRSPNLPSPLRSPPPSLHTTPTPSSPAAILTPEWPEAPSAYCAHTQRKELGGARS